MQHKSYEKHHNNLFYQPVDDLTRFLQAVFRQEALDSLLKTNIELIYKKTSMTDCSDRFFDKISAFEYVFWAYDKTTWEKMYQAIPKDKQGLQVIEKLLEQLKVLLEKGVSYTRSTEGKTTTTTEKHFDFKNTILQALQDYYTLYQKPWEQVTEATGKHQWLKNVGGAQRLLPIYVFTEYYKINNWAEIHPKLKDKMALYIYTDKCCHETKQWQGVFGWNYGQENRLNAIFADFTNLGILWTQRVEYFNGIGLQLKNLQQSINTSARSQSKMGLS